MISHDPYPSFNLKAWNIRIYLLFYSFVLSAAVPLHPNNVELQMAACAAAYLAVWFDRTERCGRYLTEEQASIICSAGLKFVEAYEYLAIHTVCVCKWHDSKSCPNCTLPEIT